MCRTVISPFHEHLVIVLVLAYSANALNTAGLISHHSTVSLHWAARYLKGAP
jgi:hypothetical protein